MELQIRNLSRNLSKTYANGVHALKDVSLTIPPGMFGLLGPNGACKSTIGPKRKFHGVSLINNPLHSLRKAISGSIFGARCAGNLNRQQKIEEKFFAIKE
jgi:hypothetical protein